MRKTRRKDREEKIIVECSPDLSDSGSSDLVFDLADVFFRSEIYIFPYFHRNAPMYNINLPIWRPAIQFAENRHESMHPRSREERKRWESDSLRNHQHSIDSTHSRQCTCEWWWMINWRLFTLVHSEKNIVIISIKIHKLYIKTLKLIVYS